MKANLGHFSFIDYKVRNIIINIMATSEISSSLSKTTSKAPTATKPKTTTFAAISKKSELPLTKATRFRESETNYSWSRWTWHIICWKFIWRYQWKWLIWIIWTSHNKLSPWQLWCPNTTFWKYWEKKEALLM